MKRKETMEAIANRLENARIDACERVGHLSDGKLVCAYKDRLNEGYNIIDDIELEALRDELIVRGIPRPS